MVALHIDCQHNQSLRHNVCHCITSSSQYVYIYFHEWVHCCPLNAIFFATRKPYEFVWYVVCVCLPRKNMLLCFCFERDCALEWKDIYNGLRRQSSEDTIELDCKINLFIFMCDILTYIYWYIKS